MITHVDVEKACQSDAHALKPAVESTQGRGLGPKELLADSLYGSDDAECPVKAGKKHYYLRYTEKEIRIAQRRAREKTPEFKDRYRFRSGIEATMSEYSTRTGVKKLRVRGLKMVRFCAILKGIGVNIFTGQLRSERP